MTRRRLLKVVASAGLATVAGGAAEAYRFDVERVKLTVPSLSGPLRVAFLCDLHWGPYIRRRSVRAWVDAALDAAPDLIVLGGDLVDRFGVGASVSVLMAELERLRAPLGTFAVWGNHDHRRMRTKLATFEARLRSAGVVVLTNRGLPVRDDLHLAGVDDAREGDPDLVAALNGRPPGGACLLACHNPDLLPEVPESVDLTLAGHTHGGQVRIPGVGAIVTSSKYGRRYAQGWSRSPALGYVSRGLGVSTIPLRIACPPELTIVEMAPA